MKLEKEIITHIKDNSVGILYRTSLVSSLAQPKKQHIFILRNMKVNTHKKSLFDKFSYDFSKVVSELKFMHSNNNKLIIDNFYLCPLTLEFYHLNDINKLTIEHVPQDSLKGKPLVLTNKEVNNKDGHTVNFPI